MTEPEDIDSPDGWTVTHGAYSGELRAEEQEMGDEKRVACLSKCNGTWYFTAGIARRDPEITEPFQHRSAALDRFREFLDSPDEYVEKAYRMVRVTSRDAEGSVEREYAVDAYHDPEVTDGDHYAAQNVEVNGARVDVDWKYYVGEGRYDVESYTNHDNESVINIKSVE